MCGTCWHVGDTGDQRALSTLRALLTELRGSGLCPGTLEFSKEGDLVCLSLVPALPTLDPSSKEARGGETQVERADRVRDDELARYRRATSGIRPGLVK